MSSVKPIPLAQENDNTEKGEGFITGWGVFKNPVKEGDRRVGPDRLQSAMMKVITNEKCGKYVWYGRYYISDFISPRHICVLKYAQTVACTGDSGGPLVVSGVLVGIGGVVICSGEIKSDPSCLNTRPSMYYRVSKVRRWITSTMSAHINTDL